MSTGEIEATYLIVGADGSNVNDGIGVVKERRPCMPLPTRSADVVQSPLYRAIGVLHDESVLCDPDGLNPSVKNIIDTWHIATFGNPIDLIKETAWWVMSVRCHEDRIPFPAQPKNEGKGN